MSTLRLGKGNLFLPMAMEEAALSALTKKSPCEKE
jgi:hypothetical protein